MSRPKSEIDWITYRGEAPHVRPDDEAAQIPGPFDVEPPKAPKVSGGKFNMSNPKSDVEWNVYRGACLHRLSP